MKENLQQSNNEFKEFGYGSIFYSPLLKTTINDLMSKFILFCDQTSAHKQNMLFKNSVGYEYHNRNQNTKSVDQKEAFYIKANYELPENFISSKTDREFVDACKKLLTEVLSLVKDSTATLSEIADTDLSQYFDNSALTLRAIHYYPDMSPEIAYHHVDRGGQTYQLYETTDGLEIFWNGKWNKPIFDQNKVIYFPGILAQLASEGGLKGLCHRVVSNNESIRNGRYSLVLFVDYFKFGYKYSMNKCGPIEKAFLPGQNYEIPFLELKNYFEERK